MTPHEYWEESPSLVIAYRKKHYMDVERANVDAWILGRYIENAVSVAVYNNFREKGKKALDYVKKPFRVLPLTEEEQRKEREKEIEKAIIELSAWAARSGGNSDINGGG